MFPYFQLEDVVIPTYYIGHTIAALTFVVIFTRRLERSGFGGEAFSLILISLFGALIGSRLPFAIVEGDYLRVIKVWAGGQSIWTGILFTALFFGIWTRVKRLPALRILDLATVPLAASYAVMRFLACLPNGCCYGIPTTLPWGMVYDQMSPAGRKFGVVPLHPTQIYEGINGIITTGALVWAERSGVARKDGDMTLIFLAVHSAIRFFTDPFRADVPYIVKLPSPLPSLTLFQIVGLLVFIASATYIKCLRRETG